MGPDARIPARQARLIAATTALLAVAACSSGIDVPADALGDDACEERVPLVVDLHGYSESVDLHEAATGWQAFGARHGIVVKTPDAGREPPRWDLDRDAAIVEGVIDDAIRDDCVDAHRVYVTGHSMGGFLTSVVACELAGRVAAVAPVAGVRRVEPCDASRPVPALIVHGSDDGIVLYDGGLSEGAAAILDMPAEGPPVPAIAGAWALRNGCDGDPAERVDGDVTVSTYPCPGGADVELRVIEGGRHEWPAGTTETIWSFFERHALG